MLADLHDRLAALADWSAPAIEAVSHAVREQHDGIALGKIAQPVRVAVTGGEVSPPIFDTLAVLGKARSVARIADAVHELHARR
jgi:glutamyl-tRNA synthetase